MIRACKAPTDRSRTMAARRPQADSHSAAMLSQEAYMSQKIIPPPSPSALDDPLIRGLTKSIRYAVRILAVLMVLVIWWGVADVFIRLTALPTSTTSPTASCPTQNPTSSLNPWP